MQSSEILQYSLIGIVVLGMTWLGTRRRTLKRVLLWVPVVAFIPVVMLNIFLGLDAIKSELYWFWDAPSFLIKSLALVVVTAILALGASLTSWTISARWGKPNWLGIIGGILAALILVIPAMIAGLLVACTSGDCL